MNKRRILALIFILALLTLSLYGCGAKASKSANTSNADYNYSVNPTSVPARGESAGYGAGYSKGDDGMTSDPAEKPVPNPNATSKPADAEIDTEKIIYTGYAEIETIDFDESVKHVYTMVERYNGFIQSSYVTGSDYSTKYYGRDSFRRAHFTIRIPKEKYTAMTDGLSELGNVTYSSNEAQNITSYYTDTESRLKAYRTEEGRLLEILEKADTVADMITIEDRLSTVRYNIESLTSQLKNWDSQVNYSTVELELREVKELSEEPILKESFWQEIKRGVTASVKWLIRFCRRAVIVIVSAIPVLIIPAIIVVLVIVLRLRHKKSKIKRSELNRDDK